MFLYVIEIPTSCFLVGISIPLMQGGLDPRLVAFTYLHPAICICIKNLFYVSQFIAFPITSYGFSYSDVVKYSIGINPVNMGERKKMK